MIKSRKKLRIIVFHTLTMLIVLTFMVGFKTKALTEAKGNKNSDDLSVIVKETGLWMVGLSIPSKEVLIDKDGIFKNPRISKDGQNVAYTKNENLYISSTDLRKGKKEAIKVSEKVVSYAWVNSCELVYSTEKGGLNGFNLKCNKSTNYIKKEERYEGIVSDKKGTIYAEAYRYYVKGGEQYIEAKGVISYELVLGKEKIVVASKPISEDRQDLGLVPTVAGISKNGAYVYIWCKVNSASINADGVAFGAYEVKNNKFTTFNKNQIFALSYKDNLAINPVEATLPVINNGGVRNMNINKALGKVDIIRGKIISILPDGMIATDGSYEATAKGMVTMTPAFSSDGKKIIFAASKANENMQKWEKDPHNIYTVDIETKKVEKITKDNTFDFAPIYISNGEGIVFARRTDKNDISLWRLQNKKEECIAKGIKLDEYSWYYGHYNLERSMDIYISN